MENRKEQHGNTTIFYLKGRLDGVSSPQIQEEISKLLEHGTQNLILDCSDLEYMSSAGIRVLLQSYYQTTKKKGKIALTSVPKSIEQTLYITGFLSYFRMYNTLQDALLSLNKDED